MHLSWIKIALLAAVPALLLGLALGWILGRTQLEHQWAEPHTTLTPAMVEKAAKAPQADPVPVAGTRVLRRLPLQKAHAANEALTAKDPVRVTLGSAGRSSPETADLHLVLDNGAGCEVVKYAGVAYGFGADGLPAAMNAGGEHFVAFSGTDPKLAPGDKGQFTTLLHHAHDANVVLAQVDSYSCADGKTWSRTSTL